MARSLVPNDYIPSFFLYTMYFVKQFFKYSCFIYCYDIDFFVFLKIMVMCQFLLKKWQSEPVTHIYTFFLSCHSPPPSHHVLSQETGHISLYSTVGSHCWSTLVIMQVLLLYIIIFLKSCTLGCAVVRQRAHLWSYSWIYSPTRCSALMDYFFFSPELLTRNWFNSPSNVKKHWYCRR